MRIINIIKALTIALLLTSCVSTKEILLSDDVLVIKSEELSKYWIPKSEKFSFNLNFKKKGYVKYKYIIDSNGNLFNPEVVESRPKGVVNNAGLMALSKLKYIPAKTNQNRRPVQVETEIVFQ